MANGGSTASACHDGPDSPLGKTLIKIAGDILGTRVAAAGGDVQLAGVEDLEHPNGGAALRIHLTDGSWFDVYVPPRDDEDTPAKP